MKATCEAYSVMTLQTIWRWLRSLGKRRALKHETDEELRFHLDQGLMLRRVALCHTEDGCWPAVSLGQSNKNSFCRTNFIRSSGKTPMAPLITERCKVVSLSTRTRDGLLSPVFRQSGCVGLTATVRAEAGAPGAEVMNATRKSSSESHCASTRHGLRLLLDKSVKGNAAWTISPARNMRELFAEPRINPPRTKVTVAVNVGLFFKKIESAAGFSQSGNLHAARIIRLQRQHGQTRVRGQRHTGGQFQGTVGLDTDFDGLHDYRLACESPLANPQLSTSITRYIQ